MGSFKKLSFSHESLVELFKQEIDHFDTINDILKYTNLMTTISNLGERRDFDPHYTPKKVQIMILGSFQMLSSSHGSLVEHFKQERDHIDSINDIFKYTNLTMTFPNLGERRLFDALYTHKKV